MAVRVRNEGLRDLQRALASFQLALERAIAREVADLTRRGWEVTVKSTPVRTGETRGAIRYGVNVRRGHVTGVVYVEGDPEKWIDGLERRYHMFARGNAYIRRNLPASVRRAVDAAAKQTFGSIGR